MQWISISDSSLIIGICEQKNQSSAITRIFKKSFSNTGDSVFFQEELREKLEKILASIDKNELVDNKFAVSLPSVKMSAYCLQTDAGLSLDEEEEILDWKIKKYLSNTEGFFIQHYPMPESNGKKSYLSIVMTKKLRSLLINIFEEQGFELAFIDVGIFSACSMLRKSFPLTAYNQWGIWLVAKTGQPQTLIISNNETIDYISFLISGDDTVNILNNTSPEKYHEAFLKKIILKDYSAVEIDKMFVYSSEPVENSVQKYMDENLDVIINPLPVLSNQKVQIGKKYLRDKYLLSQFVEIAGLISRN